MRTIARLARGPRRSGLSFGLGLAIGLGLAARGVAASNISTPCPRPAATTRPVAISHPAHQAQLLVSGQHRWRLTLTRVAVVPQIKAEFGTYRAHGKYVVVFVTAQNAGKVPASLGWDQNFALVDAQGRQFGLGSSEANVTAHEQYKLDSTFDDVQPTFTAHLAFVFDVARDARGFTLVNVPLGGDGTQKLFTLGI